MSDWTEDPEGRYSNHLEIAHNAFEFVIQFGQFYGEAGPRIHTRIITAPYYAKCFAGLLEESVRRYEETHGTIVPVEP